MSERNEWPLNAICKAQDESGYWWYYRDVPTTCKYNWRGKHIKLHTYTTPLNGDWRDTLVMKDLPESETGGRSKSDGSTASYYELPEGATELQHLISHRNLNAQDGEMFRAIYRKGRASHSDELRDAKKVLFYAQAEVERLENLK